MFDILEKRYKRYFYSILSSVVAAALTLFHTISFSLHAITVHVLNNKLTSFCQLFVQFAAQQLNRAGTFKYLVTKN